MGTGFRHGRERRLQYTVEICQDRHADGWLRCWLLTAGATHAGWHVYQKKPVYEGQALELVAVGDDGEVLGFLDVELEREPGSLCLRCEPGQGFAWEFGVLPWLWGRGIGSGLVREAERILRDQHGVRYLEWWSMDPRSQAWYERYGMECVDRHWRFAAAPDPELDDLSRGRKSKLVYAHLTCREEDWPEMQRRFRVITRPPLEPHLCKGFAHRF